MRAVEYIADTVTVRTRYGAISFYKSDTGIIPRALQKYGEWAVNEITFLGRFLPSGAVAVDVGSFVGTHALAFSELVGANGTVIAIEAQQSSFQLLAHNIAANGVTNVSALQAAAGSKVSRMVAASVPPGVGGDYASTTLTEQRSAAINIDVLSIDSLDLKSCNLIKIDVEGMESDVLLGAYDTISKFRPVIYAEANSVEAAAPVLAYLKKHDYRVLMHVVDPFNPLNFLGAKDNIFGAARENALLGLPRELSVAQETLTQKCALLLDIETIDDIVLGLLNKPQYPIEVLLHSRAAESGGNAWLENHFNQSSSDQLQVLNSELSLKQTELENMNLHVLQLSSDLEATTSTLKVVADDLAKTTLTLEAEIVRRESMEARWTWKVANTLSQLVRGKFLYNLSDRIKK